MVDLLGQRGLPTGSFGSGLAALGSSVTPVLGSEMEARRHAVRTLCRLLIATDTGEVATDNVREETWVAKFPSEPKIGFQKSLYRALQTPQPEKF